LVCRLCPLKCRRDHRDSLWDLFKLCKQVVLSVPNLIDCVPCRAFSLGSSLGVFNEVLIDHDLRHVHKVALNSLIDAFFIEGIPFHRSAIFVDKVSDLLKPLILAYFCNVLKNSTVKLHGLATLQSCNYTDGCN
jgi:hypothetical protein